MVYSTERKKHVIDYGGSIQGGICSHAQSRETWQGGAEHGASGGGGQGEEPSLLAVGGWGLWRTGEDVSQEFPRTNGSLQAKRALFANMDEHLVQEFFKIQIPELRKRRCSGFQNEVDGKTTMAGTEARITTNESGNYIFCYFLSKDAIYNSLMSRI